MVNVEKQTAHQHPKSKLLSPGRSLKDIPPISKGLTQGEEDESGIQEISSAENHLQELSSRLLNAHEEERKRIAHEVHENLAQTFVAIQLRVETALSAMKGVENPKVLEVLEPVTAILNEGLGSIRTIAGRLRPLILDDLGILVTVSRFCKEVVREHPGLSIDERLEIEERDIHEALKMVIYRILESAMCGILKQEPAGLVEISIERWGSLICLGIRDHTGGLGCEHILSGSVAQDGADPATIGERVLLSGGYLSIASQEGVGTTLQVSWPVTV